MDARISPEQRQKVIEALDTDPRLASALVAMVEAAEASNLASKSEAALAKAAAALPPVTFHIAGHFEMVDGHQSVVGAITIQGRQIAILLSEGSFNKARGEQVAYAKRLGYRVATRSESRTYLASLLAKEADRTITDAEKHALKSYRKRSIRDAKGGLDAEGRAISAFDRSRGDYAFPTDGALFVRPAV